MLDVSLTQNRKFLVTLDKKHAEYERAYILIRSLLTSYEVKPCQWTVTYDDLVYFKQKLNVSGLRNVGKTITVEAAEWFNWLKSNEERLHALKSGAENEKTRALLDGKLKSTLFEDQLTGVSYLVSSNRCGLFDTMGAGKSLEVLATVVALQPKIKKTLMVAPLGVLPGFAREIKKHTHLKALSLPQGKKTALAYLKKHINDDWDILLVHPENLVGQKNERFSPILHTLLSIKWDMILIDEFHNYKNVTAKRSQAVVKLVNESKTSEEKPPRVIMITGTPVPENPTNAYVFLKLSNFGRLPHVARFENFFTIKENVKYGSKGTFPKVVGYKNLDLLKEMIDRRSIRRTKDDLKGFPDALYSVRDILLTGRQADLYKSFTGELIASLPKESRVNLMQILQSNAAAIRMRQVLNHPSFLDEKGDSAKYVEIDSLLSELFTDPEAKVLIWTEYRKGVDLLFDRYNSQYGAIKIYGGVDINDELINTFEAKDGPRIAAAIPAKGGVGLDFLARARTSIYVDRPYSYTLYSQSLDRVVRRVSPEKSKLTWLDIVKMQPANIIFLDAANTIDEIVRAKLMEKQNLSDALLIDDDKLLEFGRDDLLQLLR